MGRKRRADGLAVIRAGVEDYPAPVIRILLVDDLLANHVVSTATTSPDDAAAMIREWLGRVTLPRGGDAQQPGEAVTDT
jgi:hypothetical protein